jgi:hypothetical protein
MKVRHSQPSFFDVLFIHYKPFCRIWYSYNTFFIMVMQHFTEHELIGSSYLPPMTNFFAAHRFEPQIESFDGLLVCSTHELVYVAHSSDPFRCEFFFW